jgi:hypothetical protein
MFDLEQSITDWRKQMLAVGIKTPVPLEELEIHLRDEIERQMKSGLNEQNAFEISAQTIGQAGPLKTEFKKIDVENWNRQIAWAAWILFAGSFFLPAYADATGWQCAGASILLVIKLKFATWMSIHWELLALANLLMVFSPLFLTRFSQKARSMKCFRLLTFWALVLVWSFFLELVALRRWNQIRFGNYIWELSFLLLYLSTLKTYGRKNAAAVI